MNKIAVVLTNYNMPERTNAICEYINSHTKCEYDLVIVDNGSDITEPSKYTTVKLDDNIQTCGGWLAGLKSLSEKYFAYILAGTSIEFIGNDDHISIMREFLENTPNAVGIMPALTSDSNILCWEHMKTRGGNEPRRTWGLDLLFTMLRAEWFDKIGWLDPALIYAWGTSEETSWKARRDNKSLWIHEGIKIRKAQNIGYKMNRMNMSADDRSRLGMRNVIKIMQEKYGENWIDKMSNEYVENVWR